MMNFDNFKKAVVEGLEARGCEVKTDIVRKNNTEYTSLIILEEGKNIYPTFPLEEAFMAYKKNECLSDILDSIQNFFKEVPVPKELAVEDFGITTENIVSRIIGKNTNKELLKDAICYPLDGTDLVVTFRQVILWDEDGIGSRLLKKGDWPILNALGINNEDNLLLLGLSNFRRLMGCKTICMGDICETEGADCMHILTAQEMGMNGATYIADKGLLKKEMERLGYESLLILPSSVHELILMDGEHLPEGKTLENLYNLVVETNKYVVAPQDVLSNNLYFFDGELSSYR